MKKRPYSTCLAVLPMAIAALTFSAMNGRGDNPAYPSVVEADGALGYYRFNDSLTRTLINVNTGSLGAAGNASNDLATITSGVVYSMPGAIVGDGDRASFFDYTTRTEVPFNSAFNSPNAQPFSVEAWLYPVSDQVGTGMGALCNRWTQGGNRQGWVMYQRAPDTNHNITAGPGLGWEFRMYDDVSTSTALDVISGVPFTLGKWQHLVVVYDPVQVSNATLTIYIDGVKANQATWNGGSSGTAPGYGPCTGKHDPSQAVNGQPAMSLGGYNNANSGTAGFANPWTGGVDEFAWYNAKLTPAQVLAHYQNGTNAARSTPYATLINSDNPVVYLRLGEHAPGPDTAFNIGDLRSAGDATPTSAIKHPGTGALAGQTSDGSHSGHYRDTSASGHALTSIPWTAANNPDAGVPFTVEAWFRPTGDQMNPGPCPINNRLANGITDRTGWVIYQRDPNLSYQGPPAVSGESGLGWTFRPYTGSGGSSGGDLQLAAPYNLGEWLHFVVTWEPFQDMGAVPSGSEQWMGVLTGYINGVPVVTNGDLSLATGPVYAANASPTADGRTPADFAIGSYNAASGYGEEFEGDVDEVAFYNNYALTPDQILTHYQTGTNAHPATNYASLVFNAAGDTYYILNGTIPEHSTIPPTYLRFNELAYCPATNAGSLGYLANSSLVLATNNAAGPASAGFEADNSAVMLNGTNNWVSLNNPLGLEVTGKITLEAWIKPDTTQGNLARIISHGPSTPTVYDTNTYPIVLSGSQLSSNEVFLRIEGGTTYAVGTSDGFTTHGASAAVIAGDLGGANGWIYLAGTYDGSHWNLYRNGVPIATTADAVGALPVTGGEWAVGATGMGWGDFYTGLVDEVAIYGTALSAANIQNHYNVAQNGAVALNFNPPVLKNGLLTISWTGTGTLLQSTNVVLPMSQWTTVPGNPTSPYQVTPAAAGPRWFYRLRQ
jgi:Concanavalin A-like lectin/glucanases superfamily